MPEEPRPVSPIHGFYEDGQPCSAIQQPRLRASSWPVNSGEGRRRHSTSTLHVPLLPSITEDLLVTDFSSNLRKGDSRKSLDWDGYTDPDPDFNSSAHWSTNTQFDVSVTDGNSFLIATSPSKVEPEIDDSYEEAFCTPSKPTGEDDIPRGENINNSSTPASPSVATQLRFRFTESSASFSTPPEPTTDPSGRRGLVNIAPASPSLQPTRRFRFTRSSAALDTSNSQEINVVSTMAATKETKAHRTAVLTAEMFVEDDIKPTRPDHVTLDFLSCVMTSAQEHKEALQAAMIFLSINDVETYQAEFKDVATNTKKELIQFIVEAQAYMRQEADKANSATTEKTKAADSALKIKKARVNESQDAVCEEIYRLVDEFKSLNLINPESDHQYYSMQDRFVGLASRSEDVQKDARALRNDAADAGLEEPASKLDKCIRTLKQIHSECNIKLSEFKEGFGIRSKVGAGRLDDYKPPQYRGEYTDKIDYFSFREEFEEYCTAKNLSLSEQLRILTRTCLQGAARTLCLHLDNVENVWKTLEQSYGNPDVLLNMKVEEVRKLGNCKDSWSFAKKREWGINVQAKLKHLLELCVKFNIETDLYYSPIIAEVRNGLPAKDLDDFLDIMKKIPGHGLELKKASFNKLLEYLQEFINDGTFRMNLEGSITVTERSKSKSTEQSTQPKPVKKVYASSSQPSSDKQHQGRGSKPANKPANNATKPSDVNCQNCNKSHTHLYYCEKFQECSVKDRYELTAKSRVCFRCLRMDSKVDFNDRSTWFEKHADDCQTSFYCKQGNCGNRQKKAQYHFTMCEWHLKKNKELEDDFIKSLVQSLLPRNPRFFFALPSVYTNVPEEETNHVNIRDGWTIIPDVNEPSIFMVQLINIEPGKDLLGFYDSGCMGAGISDRAYSALETETVREGPTSLNVASGEVISIPHGDERFLLPLAGTNSKATLTGLRMESLTTPFPFWELQAAWEDVNEAYNKEYPGSEPLPTVDKSIGGVPVDLMIGIRYSKYFPTLMYSLPGGLSVYKAQFRTSSGNLGILGGPHKAWRESYNTSHHMGYRAYFTAEYRAYAVQNSSVYFCTNPMSDAPEITLPEVDKLYAPSTRTVCSNTHCSKHQQESGWMIHNHWKLTGTQYHIKDEERRFVELEDLGTDIEYRCVSCRNCAKCRQGDELERISLKEEVEQSLIEGSVSLNIQEKRIDARLPFIEDPLQKIRPNRYQAEKVLESQLRNISKSEDMKQDVLQSHKKLQDRGHVVSVKDLSPEELERMNSMPGDGYIIPWRTVYKESSLSTPCRMVFDASAKTPGGESLNNILAKGRNKLEKILHILLRFRRKPFAFACDVSMAYNGLKLVPEHYKFQQYLWKLDLNPDNETLIMIIKTLIYGVRPSGSQTMEGFSKLSDHTIINHPEHSLGAEFLKSDAYMDDVLGSADTQEDLQKIAEGINFTLAQGGMGVKDFTFSGKSPSDKVSSDGINIGLVGYLWDPVKDELKLDVKQLYLGKPKRGKLPELVTGDIGDALKKKFTRRTLTGKVNGVYDPLGLVTPMTAKLKLDLHDIVVRKLDWDDHVPEHLLPRWVENLQTIQDIRNISFRRAVIPMNAVSTDVELLVSVDSSENIAVAAVHSRVLLKDDSYHCQLLTAKSKLVSGSTIPRAELKGAVVGAVLGHIAKRNFGSQVRSITYITDSTICLYWINQDERPMQIAIRNSVIQIRRFSFPDQWYHTDTSNNIADTGTRTAPLEDIDERSDWQNGRPWMRLPREQFPLRNAAEITLTGEEKRTAATELKAPDIGGHVFINLKSTIGDRYTFSKYIVDPNIRKWPMSVRILARVLKFIRFMRPKKYPRKDAWNPRLTDEDIDAAEKYFFKKGTLEVKQFSKQKEWKDQSHSQDGVLLYTGRILDGQQIVDIESTMTDLQPLSFVKPILDRYSPLAYSIMVHCHWSVAHHRNAISTLRESRNIAYILRGRDLANEVRDSCVFCKRFKMKLLEAEMGKLHDTRLTIAPPFYNCQIDLMGPFLAICEHNHRSTVKIWGLVFKDPATCAVSVYVMQQYNTAAFLQAYTRFSSRHGHPAKLYMDAGSQLVKAGKEMEISLVDIVNTLEARHQVGTEYSTCPVGGHNFHGMVERSIREIRKLFEAVYRGLRLDILSYETAFSWCSNELNNLPICIGSRYQSLDHSDLITPNRLLLGRNNRRSAAGFCKISSPSRMIKQMEQVHDSWWKVWKEEKLVDFIPKPSQWLKTGYEPQVGDVVIFLKTEGEVSLGDPIWRLGLISSTEKDRDKIVRAVLIKYRNPSEAVFRETRRSVRRIAVLHKEGELELVEVLNEAAKQANLAFFSSPANLKK